MAAVTGRQDTPPSVLPPTRLVNPPDDKAPDQPGIGVETERRALSTLAAARQALARGDLIATHDLARAALDGGDPDAAYLLVLSLARMGDTDGALARYAALGLDAATDPEVRALGARLAKDAARTLAGAAQRDQFAVAAAAYAAIHADTGDMFPGINAASLTLLAGDAAEARRRAAALLADTGDPADFWAAASRAEALLILGRDGAAGEEMARAAGLPGDNLGARATTLKQFELLAEHAGCDPAGGVRALLRPAATIFYCGHMFRADAAAEDALAARIDAALAEHGVGIAFGALACGSDIVFAERVLARGGELNIVLPFATAAFVALSVDPGGPGWRSRFEACLARATSVRIVSDSGDLGDPQALGHSSAVAMGLARLRADELGGAACLLAVWDGRPARGDAGTGIDVARWQATGLPATIVAPGPIDRALAPMEAASSDLPPRAVMAIVFADVPNFTSLAEGEIPGFWREVMGAAAAVLDRHRDAVRSRNSWGDAVFAVIDGVAAAAAIVLDLQAALEGLDTRFAFRIGAHCGPVFETVDPVTGLTTFYGREVSRTARIEPVTPPGQVYVTEAFAAALAMEARGHVGCRYVGLLPLAKAYGVFPMYRLFAV